MTLDQAHKIVRLLEDAGVDGVEVREEYSGRCMYGKTCVALYCDVDCWTEVGWACGVLGMTLREVPSRSDALGTGVVLY